MSNVEKKGFYEKRLRSNDVVSYKQKLTPGQIAAIDGEHLSNDAKKANTFLFSTAYFLLTEEEASRDPDLREITAPPRELILDNQGGQQLVIREHGDSIIEVQRTESYGRTQTFCVYQNIRYFLWEKPSQTTAQSEYFFAEQQPDILLASAATLPLEYDVVILDEQPQVIKRFDFLD